MKETTARKATKNLHPAKKLENQTTLSKGQPVEYLQFHFNEVYVSSVQVSGSN